MEMGRAQFSGPGGLDLQYVDPDRRGRATLVILLCALGAVIPIYYSGRPTSVGFRDFTDIWLAGRAVLAGVNPSDPQAFSAFGQRVFGDYPFNWPYPPPMLFVAVPASLLPYTPAFFVWNAATMAFFYFASRPFLPRRLRVWAVLSPAALLSVIFGQTGLLVGGLWFLAFRYAPLAALLMIKPHLGFLAGFRSLTSWRSAAIGGASVAAIVVLSAIIFGGWASFLLSSGSAQSQALWNGRWITWVLVATAPGVGYGVYGWLFFAAFAAWLLSHDFNVWTAATATMLISPYGYHYDMTVVCAGFLAFLYERPMEPWKVAVIIVAFLSPAWVRVVGTWFVPPVLLVALAIQTELGRQIDHAAVGRIESAIRRGIERAVRKCV
jgi:hypothetical protein